MALHLDQCSRNRTNTMIPRSGGGQLARGEILTLRVGGWQGDFGVGTLILTCCQGDVNGDQMVGVDDLLILLAAWGTSMRDLDGDGIVNVPDLLMLLAAWGACS